jgi:hypothetical protein
MSEHRGAAVDEHLFHAQRSVRWRIVEEQLISLVLPDTKMLFVPT